MKAQTALQYLSALDIFKGKDLKTRNLGGSKGQAWKGRTKAKIKRRGKKK